MSQIPEATFAASAQYHFGASASTLDETLVPQDGTRNDSVVNFFHASPRAVSTGDNRTYSRTVYSPQQVAKLEQAYSVCRFAAGARINEISSRIGVDERKIRNWFKNRRAKDRKNASVNECKKNSLMAISEDNHIDSHQGVNENYPINHVLEHSTNSNAAAFGNYQNVSSVKRPRSYDLNENPAVTEDNAHPAATGLPRSDDVDENPEEIQDKAHQAASGLPRSDDLDENPEEIQDKAHQAASGLPRSDDLDENPEEIQDKAHQAASGLPRSDDLVENPGEIPEKLQILEQLVMRPGTNFWIRIQ